MTVIRPRKDWQFNAHTFPRWTVRGAAAAVDVLLRCLSISESPFRRRVFNIYIRLNDYARKAFKTKEKKIEIIYT